MGKGKKVDPSGHLGTEEIRKEHGLGLLFLFSLCYWQPNGTMLVSGGQCDFLTKMLSLLAFCFFFSLVILIFGILNLV